MNDERIKQLEELGFVWALRGQEGSRRDEAMLQESENFSNGSIVAAELVPVLPQDSVTHSHQPHGLPPSGQEDILEEPSAMPAYQNVQEV